MDEQETSPQTMSQAPQAMCAGIGVPQQDCGKASESYAPKEMGPGPWEVEPLCGQIVTTEQEIAKLKPIATMCRDAENRLRSLRYRLEKALKARALL